MAGRFRAFHGAQAAPRRVRLEPLGAGRAIAQPPVARRLARAVGARHRRAPLLSVPLLPAMARAARVLPCPPNPHHGRPAHLRGTRQRRCLGQARGDPPRRQGRPHRGGRRAAGFLRRPGQGLGNPIYRWDIMAAEGYRWWLDRFRAVLAQFDLIRLDHFRGFEAYWEVPATEPTAEHGRWVKGPGAALFEAVRQELGDLPFVAENLGVITPE